MSGYIIVALIAYLCGSISFGYILVRIFKGKDIRESGSGNIGATNVARTAPGLGVATLILDAGKGVAALVLARFFISHWLNSFGSNISGQPWEFWNNFSTSGYLALASLFVIAGHMFPVWLKFKGGKGVATSAGAFAMLAPKAILVTLLIFLFLVSIFRYVSLGSIIAAAVFPVFTNFFYANRFSSLALVLISCTSLLIIIKHQQNIRRLLAGNENRFGKKKIAVLTTED